MPKKEVTEDDLKKMKTIFCIDASGSVDGVTTYHNVTRNIFNKFYKSGDLIWLWGSSTKNKIYQSLEHGIMNIYWSKIKKRKRKIHSN